jgi:hypothetical protein
MKTSNPDNYGDIVLSKKEAKRPFTDSSHNQFCYKDRAATAYSINNHGMLHFKTS